MRRAVAAMGVVVIGFVIGFVMIVMAMTVVMVELLLVITRHSPPTECCILSTLLRSMHAAFSLAFRASAMSDGTKSAEGRALMTSVDCRCNSCEICNGYNAHICPART